MSDVSFNDILENLNYFEEWEERYQYIIALGAKLPPFPDEKTDEYKVDGCVSQVWLKCEVRDGQLYFYGDSDAFIVKGLVAILFSIYQGRTPEQILSANTQAALLQLGLEQHISPNRRNGFFSMVEKIRDYAKEQISG